MQGLTVDSNGKLTFAELSIPEYGECQALVKLRSCGICNGTDMKLIHGTFKNFNTYPAILGHEGVGEVVAVGGRVENFQIGDLVLLPFLEQGSNGYEPGWGAFSEYAIVGDWKAYVKQGKGSETSDFQSPIMPSQ